MVRRAYNIFGFWSYLEKWRAEGEPGGHSKTALMWPQGHVLPIPALGLLHTINNCLPATKASGSCRPKFIWGTNSCPVLLQRKNEQSILLYLFLTLHNWWTLPVGPTRCTDFNQKWLSLPTLRNLKGDESWSSQYGVSDVWQDCQHIWRCSLLLFFLHSAFKHHSPLRKGSWNLDVRKCKIGRECGFPASNGVFYYKIPDASRILRLPYKELLPVYFKLTAGSAFFFGDNNSQNPQDSIGQCPFWEL